MAIPTLAATCAAKMGHSVHGLEQFAFGEVADEGEVGGEEVVGGECRDGAPKHLVEDAVIQVAGEGGDSEELDFDGAAIAVGVADRGDAAADGGRDAKLFVELADEGSLGALAGLDFTSGELPFEAHGLVGPALADEDFAVGGFTTEDESRDNSAEWLRGGRGAAGYQLADGLFHLPAQCRRFAD